MWPYALKSQKNPVGVYRGVLYPGCLGDILCYAKGEAERLFDYEIKPTILDFLKDNSSRIQESDSFLLLMLFMVGKRPERSKPVVMFVGDDKPARKEAFDLVEKSDIISSHPGACFPRSKAGDCHGRQRVEDTPIFNWSANYILTGRKNTPIAMSSSRILGLN